LIGVAGQGDWKNRLVEAQPVTNRRTSGRHQKGIRFTTPRF